jgi:DNA-nicking Smr family endonuclease
MARSLTRHDAALWARVARTVDPLEGREIPLIDDAEGTLAPQPKRRTMIAAPPGKPAASAAAKQVPPAPRPLSVPPDRTGLDAGWEKRLNRAQMQPDFTLDLHGCTLDAAWQRLNHGIAQAVGMNARLVLVITGKPRPVDPADRGHRRGAIRAKVVDWIAAGPHAGRIAAIRKAHRRHGGEGALYLVLKRG